MPGFKYNRINFVATKRLVLLGRCEFQHTLGTRCRPVIKSENDIAGKVISHSACANAHLLATQVLKIEYAGIGASDNGKCFRVQRDHHAKLRTGTGRSERSLTMVSGQGYVGLRKPK